MRLIPMALISAVIGAAGPSRVEAAPYSSYTYDAWGTPVPAPPAYLPARVINLDGLGLGRFRDPQDVFVGRDRVLYILDSGNDRLVCLDEHGGVLRVIDGFIRQGRRETFSNPCGLFVTDAGAIYIADKGNSRVVALDSRGGLMHEIADPAARDTDGVLPAGFSFRPVKVAVDKAGRIFVVSENVFDGLMEFDSTGTFRGFAGAPRVYPSLFDVFWAKLATREQKQRINLFLPTEYNNLDADERGFIYATVSTSDEKKQLLCRLNVLGEDILRRRTAAPPVGDVLFPKTGAEIVGPSVFTDVATRGMDTYSVLDRKRGRIFTYDESGCLLYEFGGLGGVKGAFSIPVALDTLDEDILVLDRGTNLLTVFKPTAYADLITAALLAYYQGHYQNAVRLWRKVLKHNGNYEVGYTNIGRALLSLGRYKDAMASFRLANNRPEYSQAFRESRREWMGRNFGWMAGVLLLFAVALIILTRTGSRRPEASERSGRMARLLTEIKEWENRPRDWRTNLKRTWYGVRYAGHVIFHPFDGFWDLKYEKRGNVPAATVLLIGAVLMYLFMRQYTGFIFNTRNVNQINILTEILSVLLPFLLWTVVNWAITSLMEGKGSFRDIYIYTAFALTPLILINPPLTLLSNVMTIEEGAFYHLFVVLGAIWAGVLLFLGTLVTHEYDVPKTIGASILIILGIAFLVFLSLLFATVLDQLIKLVLDIGTEIRLRS